MNILVITKGAWDDRIASGNTLSNFFDGWDDVRFFCLYSRDAEPYNDICKEYYSISPLSIIKNFFHPAKIGRRFSYKNHGKPSSNSVREEKIIGMAKRKRSLFEFGYYLLYTTNLWRNRTFKKFIADCAPDIVFCFGQSDPLTYKALKYVRNNTKARVVSYYVDDLYRNHHSVFDIIQKQKNHYLKGIAQMSDLCYAITQSMCNEYKDLYGKTFQLLHKGCDISPTKTFVNSPIRLVYAGNLFYHRDRILGKVAKVIEKINDGNQKACLDIYSGTPVDDEVLSMLNIAGASTLHAARPYEEIKQMMREADIVLHVESFDEEQMKLVRLSFSTKITDCMQSGAMMLAIGPPSVASIDYATRVPGCVVVNDLEKLDETVQSLVANSTLIIDNAAKTNKFAMEHVELSQLRNKIHMEFENLIK